MRLDPPMAAGTLLGRSDEVKALSNLLTSSGQRMIRVVGLNGVGKTRTVIALAGALQRQGWHTPWISHGLRNGPRAGTAPKNGASSSSRDQPADPDGEVLREAISHVDARNVLLVLDDLAAGAAIYDELETALTRHPGLRIVSTSRDPRHMTGEQLFPVGPLPVAGSTAAATIRDVENLASVQLLLSHLRAFHPQLDFDASSAAMLSELSRLLDGIPGVLEHVASWSLVHPPSELIELIYADPFPLCASPTQETDVNFAASLTETIRQLEPDLRTLLTKLSDRTDTWSIDEVASLVGGRSAEAARGVYALLISGCIRAVDEPGRQRFTVLNLVRRAVLGTRPDNGPLAG
ncbi:hypothetical protein [Micromonospora rifamycinica]|uniref:hypothetical protein n=1 Tax=Micromonospora rifamycinica TaxID=291594 RepID=UPI001E5A2D1F|nr:hypothetical protein [Micromonospora rifamycinica]